MFSEPSSVNIVLSLNSAHKQTHENYVVKEINKILPMQDITLNPILQKKVTTVGVVSCL